jgi:hypothetical protein
MDSPEFVFSTTHPETHEPRARYCIFRSLWGELPENKHNTAPKNERVYESELLCFTTDNRMQKVSEFSNGEALEGSGGGGVCEAVFWVKGDVMVQWRIKGRAYVVGEDIDEVGGEGVRGELQERMRVVSNGEGKKEQWSWKMELTGHFGNMSPGMRGSFRNPPPGMFLLCCEDNARAIQLSCDYCMSTTPLPPLYYVNLEYSLIPSLSRTTRG